MDEFFDEIYKTVEVIVQKYLEKAKMSQQVAGVVLGTSGKDDGKYIVSVKNGKYLMKDGVGINPKPNTSVWVCVPNGDWNSAYICAKK